MVIILLIVGIIHGLLFVFASMSIHEDMEASAVRKFFAFLIAFTLPIIGPLISSSLVAEPIPSDLVGNSATNGDGGYTSGGDSGGCGGDGGGC